MATIKTSQLDQITTLSNGDLLALSKDLGGGSYQSKNIQMSNARIYMTSLTVTSKSTNYSSNVNEVVLASNGITITLPDASSISGSRVIVKNVGATGSITINTSLSQTIDGDSSKTISSSLNSLTFISDGSNWYII